MARKNYDAIARAAGRAYVKANRKEEVTMLVSEIADALAGVNANFDRNRFFVEYQRAAKMVSKRLEPIHEQASV